MFALAIIITLSTAFSTVEVQAGPCWWHHIITTNFDETTCCLTITVGHSYDNNCYQVRILQKNQSTGIYEVVAGPQIVTVNANGHLTAVLCAKPGDTKIDWRVETHNLSANPIGWELTTTTPSNGTPSSGSVDISGCGTDDSCRNHYSTSARLIEKDGKCCIEITVKNSVGCRGLLNFHASYFKDGMPVILAHEQVYTDITADGEYVYIICDLPEDTSVTWNVDYEEANPNGGPPFIKRIGGGAFTVKFL